MDAAVKSNRAGEKYGHMHLVLDKKLYHIATWNSMAIVTQIKTPEEVNPTFKTETDDNLSCYRVYQFEAETK